MLFFLGLGAGILIGMFVGFWRAANVYEDWVNEEFGYGRKNK